MTLHLKQVKMLQFSRSMMVKMNRPSLIRKTKNDGTHCVNTIVIALDAACCSWNVYFVTVHAISRQRY